MTIHRKTLFSMILVAALSFYGSCSKKEEKVTPPGPPTPPPPAAVNDVDWWVTKGDMSSLLQKQAGVLSFVTTAPQGLSIDVDSATTFQTIDGFGYTLTSGSASLINGLSTAARTDLLNELFGTATNGIGISYLRISIGASDLSASVYTYNDLPTGETDPTQAKFSLAPDKGQLIPLLKQILAISPTIKILATPWTPPVWMKDNGSSIGGSLLPQYYASYAQYFVRYIQQMKAEGITIDAVTPQNEPLHPGNNPSLLMLATQQATFIGTHLGPAFAAAGINTKIIAYDHNADRPDYPLAVLGDAVARPFVNGSAFHLYAGDISALTTVHNAFPDKHIYFTEQYTASNGSFGGDLKWHLKNVIIGSMRNWSRNALEWNLANDPSYGPHTPGGCTTCKGAVTIGADVLRNVAYYIIAHASKFVPAGSVRVQSNVPTDLPNVAFVTPAGKKVLIVLNDGGANASFSIRFKGRAATATLGAGAVGTFVW